MPDLKTQFQKIRWPLAALMLVLFVGLGIHAIAVIQDELRSYPASQKGLLLPNAEWQETRFQTVDRLTLAGWYAPTQNGQTIVVLHGFAGNRSQVLPVAEMLRKEGFGVLTYDTRAHGQSDGKEIGYGEKEVEDLRAALDWLETRAEVDVSRIGVYAFSLGGYIALQQAVSDKRIASLVLANTPSTIFGLAVDEGGGGIKGYLDGGLRFLAAKTKGLTRYDHSGIKAIAELKGRSLLLISSENDEVVPTARVRELFDAAPYPKTLAIFPRATHDNVAEVDAARFQKLVRNHFRRTLDKRRVLSSGR